MLRVHGSSSFLGMFGSEPQAVAGRNDATDCGCFSR
jgi:hypothetical protein